MIVDLGALDLDDRAGAVLFFAEVIESGAEVPFPLPVEGRISVSRAGGVTWVRGEVGTDVILTCARPGHSSTAWAECFVKGTARVRPRWVRERSERRDAAGGRSCCRWPRPTLTSRRWSASTW